MELPRIILKRKAALALFIMGAVFCVLPEIFGISAVAAKPFLRPLTEIPVPDKVFLPLLFGIPAVITGLFTKRTYNAAIYGACIGQCQFLLPFLLYFLMTPDGDALEIVWRMCCGLPLTASLAGAAYSVKTLIINNKKQKEKNNK